MGDLLQCVARRSRNKIRRCLSGERRGKWHRRTAIAIPGIFNGYRQPKDEAGNNLGTPYLIPQLQILAKEGRLEFGVKSSECGVGEFMDKSQKLSVYNHDSLVKKSSTPNPEPRTPNSRGREIYFAFDSDSKASTIANVNMAIEKTAKLLEKEGCTCRVISWSNQYKGVDDFIVAMGVFAFNQAYQQAQTIALWKVTRLKQLTYRVTVEIDPLLRYLPKLDIPSTAKIIGLKARKGRGKTHQIAELVSEAIRQGRRTLIISHRRQLVANLCDRCGIDNVTEYRSSDSGGVFGYGLCVDSLRRHSQARFNPEEWEDALIIIDEVEQVFWHLLSASTQVKQYRVEILKNFRTLLRVVIGSQKGQVLVADADLSDISLEYIRSLVKNAPEPLIIHQPFDPSTITPEERWDIINYDHSNCKRLIPDEFIAQKQEEVKHIGSQLKEVCVNNCEVYRHSVSNAEKFDDREYEQVSRRLNPTQEERTRLHKTRLSRQYYTDDVSPELVALDEKEGYIRLKLHYYLTVGRPYLKRRERHRLDKLLKQGQRFAIFERWLAKEPPLPQEQPSPIDWALELLQRLEMPSVSFVDDESANLFLRRVEDKLSGVIEQVEQVCSGFCGHALRVLPQRFWRAFTSAISHV